ncbi:YqgE/AlgH family protein [Pleomorphomonas koreensis]|uniref:YqgE/AlgH family protein n=1 Tax=Pleomorphomonas koreensis TaxID=257440 RepID=UPI000402AFEA|nr:YqgE/AlgH family protein [Pleomorphomonas koreensis]
MAGKANYLDGKFLIAMPALDEGDFSRAVIYMCAHSAEGAMGLVINKPLDHLSFPDLLVQLEIIPDEKRIRLPSEARAMRVHRGGPVDTGRGFVLHTADFHLDAATLPISEDLSLTATVEILKAIAEGRGPEHSLLTLGYAGWAPGQLESEIQSNGWLTTDADPEIIFGAADGERYRRALATLGVDLAALSPTSGRA